MAKKSGIWENRIYNLRVDKGSFDFGYVLMSHLNGISRIVEQLTPERSKEEMEIYLYNSLLLQTKILQSFLSPFIDEEVNKEILNKKEYTIPELLKLLQELIKLMFRKGLLGRVVADIDDIEWEDE